MPQRVNAGQAPGSPPKLLEPRRVGGRVLGGVLHVSVSKLILDEPCIRSLIGKSETEGVAQDVGIGAKAHASNGAGSSRGQIEGCTVQWLPLPTDKDVLPDGFIRARSFSHAAMARSSSPRNGCVAGIPPFNRATWNTQLSVLT